MAEQTGTLVSARTVMAENLVAALGMSKTEGKVAAVEQVISDEVSAMQSHFALAVADIQHSYNEALAEFKSAWSFVDSNRVVVSAVALALVVVGAVVGHFV